MKNKAYPYCTPPQMNNLKEMINRLAVEKADDTAFVYPCESGEMHKTYYDFKEDVYAFGAWMYSKKIIDLFLKSIDHILVCNHNILKSNVPYFCNST